MGQYTALLTERSDPGYAAFHGHLIPNVPTERILGVRVPVLRQLAKQLVKEESVGTFLSELPHTYYDEDMLHVLILSELKDYSYCMEQVERFLPYVDNWAVCDILSPKVFRKHRTELLEKIREWTKSEQTYICRFGIGMLMSHFLDEDFKPEYLEIPAAIRSEEYYVKMMVAWYFATALAKQWETAITYLEQSRLDDRTHAMTLQKARESSRISEEQKACLKTLKR